MFLLNKILKRIIRLLARTFFAPVIGEWCYNSLIKTYLHNPHHKCSAENTINLILQYGDPIIDIRVMSLNLRMHLSHRGLLYYAKFHEYDRALPRIAKSLAVIDKHLSLIDVGANIGDTVALVANSVDSFDALCIEGEPEMIKFLRYNTAKIKNVNIVIEPYFCAASVGDAGYSIDTHNGTSNLVKTDTSALSNIDTLDNMVFKHDVFKKANLLKIDTDGFEIAVLQGAHNVLKDIKPVVFLEFNPLDYEKNGQDAMTLINMFVSFEYTKALFYTNFGNLVGLYDFTDCAAIQGIINKIDGKTIYYYDLLTIPDSKAAAYASIFEHELSYHT